MNYTFKVGDVVRCTRQNGNFYAGKTYTVIKLYEYSSIDAFWAKDDKGIRDATEAKYFVLAGTPLQQFMRRVASNV